MKPYGLRFLLLCSIALLFTACKKEEIFPDEPIGTERYNERVFNTSSISSGIAYGSSVTQSGNTQTLMLDVYEPDGDDAQMRPLIVLAHGGGFTGGDKEEFEDLADFLAKSGYVVASINYRLLDVENSPERITQAVLDAVFDMKAAVRFFKADAAGANAYRIDPDQVFVGGYSAGAFMGLHYGYLNSEEEVTTMGGSALLSHFQSEGGIEGSSGNPGVSSAVKGVINFSGALFLADFVDAGEPALFSVHGTDDEVVPYLAGESDGSGVSTEGSGLIHPVAESAGIVNQLITINSGDHGAFQSCETCHQDLRSFLFTQVK